MTVEQSFRQIEISGTPHQRGLAHGQQMKTQIADALVYYRDIFKLPDDQILERAAHFRRVITDFDSDYGDEINAIAQGAEQDPLWIFALNARTEILAVNGGLFANECTSLCFTNSSVLGQTWDWGKTLEGLCAIMRITRPDGHVIQMLTEPGIIGKIGMNNAGLGVCLNILAINENLDGVPIHVMLRAILDCKSARQAAQIIKSAASGKSSNVMVADATGNSFDTEFAAGVTLAPAAIGGIFIHTNHYLGKPINDLADPAFENSRCRLATATNSVANGDKTTVETMKKILSDRSHNQFPIFRPYVVDEQLREAGTVATFVMDLPARQMHVRKGNGVKNEFEIIAVK